MPLAVSRPSRTGPLIIARRAEYWVQFSARDSSPSSSWVAR